MGALDVAAQKVLIGHISPPSGWVVDASVSRTLVPGIDYTVKQVIKGTSVSGMPSAMFLLSPGMGIYTSSAILPVEVQALRH